MRELRHAVRQFGRSPVFTAVCVLTLALGVGANTAVFSVMNAVLFRYAPVRNPEQLVYFHYANQPLGTSQTGYGDTSLPLSVYEQLGAQHAVFSDVVAFAPIDWPKAAVRFGADPEQAAGEEVSGNFFSGLGVKPALGRGFTARDEHEHTAVAVLSYSWWVRRFAADPAVVGQTMYIKGLPFTIVGVGPRGFDGVDPGLRMDFWIPLQNRPELNAWGNPASDHTLYGSPDWYCLLIVGRLKPGLTQRQAIAQVTPTFERAAYAGVPSHDPHEPKARLWFSPLRGVENLREDYQGPLRFLLGMVMVVLVIGCANVAMLLLARNSARQREFAVRIALGAGRSALFRQLAIESVLLVTTGAVLGWWFAKTATQQLTRWSGVDLTVTPDRNVLLFTLTLAALAAVVFGLMPLRAATSVSLAAAMKTSSATSNTDRTRFFGRKLVISSQIALCVVVLVAAGLLMGSLRRLQSRDAGMRTAGLVVFGINPQKNVTSDAAAVRFHNSLLARLRSVPGVVSATLMQNRLGTGSSNNTGVFVDGRNPLPAARLAPVRWNAVGPRFLHVLGIPVLLGRDVSDTDTSSSAKVAIVNRAFVDRYLPHTPPIGHHIALLPDEKTQYTIVGVAQNSLYLGLREKERPMAYLPYTQVTGIGGMQFELRTAGDSGALLEQVRRVVHDVDPDLPLERPTTQRAEFEQSVSQDRLIANLATSFGLLAAMLVAVGLYGTLAYAISRRTVEFGLRMALGAERTNLLWMVLRESAMLTAIGACAGIPAAIAVGRMLQSTLFGISPTNPLAIAAALAGIVCVTLIATWLPARRAASVDPLTALRAD